MKKVLIVRLWFLTGNCNQGMVRAKQGHRAESGACCRKESAGFCASTTNRTSEGLSAQGTSLSTNPACSWLSAVDTFISNLHGPRATGL